MNSRVKKKNPDGGLVRIVERESTNGVNGEGRAVWNGGVFAEEDDLMDRLAGELFPTEVQVVLVHYEIVMLQ